MSDTMKFCVARVADGFSQFPSLLCYPNTQIPARFDTIEEVTSWAQLLGMTVHIVKVEVVANLVATYGVPELNDNANPELAAWWMDNDAGVFRLKPNWREILFPQGIEPEPPAPSSQDIALGTTTPVIQNGE